MVEPVDTLLELHRDFTDKEKLGLVNDICRRLRNELENVTKQNNNLKKKVKELEDKVKEDEYFFPSKINGSEFVKAKTHLKLHKRYKELDKRFWELVHEMKAEKL